MDKQSPIPSSSSWRSRTQRTVALIAAGLSLLGFLWVTVLAGVRMAGALGVFLVAPFVASTRMLAQYVYDKMTDQNPFPENRHTRTASD